MIRKEEIFLEFQPYVEAPPVAPGALHQQACQNDGVTIDSWRKQWIDNIRENHKRFGPFKEHSLGQLRGLMAYRPCIVAGSGPSLKHNVDKLKDRGQMGLISCLHNFHFMEDHDAAPDFYVTLDAGPITVGEVTEGGTKDEEWYWERTKERTLLAYVGTHPTLLEKWRGKIYFYSAPIPDEAYQVAVKEIEAFGNPVSSGGNVFGCATYIAKVYMGANPIIFVGASFSFGYNEKFHSWDSKYDKDLGHFVRATDIFGNKVKTWQSYHNFKCWFDRTAMVVPGIWINASEGGTLGAYPEGNIRAIEQMTLDSVYEMYKAFEHPAIVEQSNNPEIHSNVLLF